MRLLPTNIVRQRRFQNNINFKRRRNIVIRYQYGKCVLRNEKYISVRRVNTQRTFTRDGCIAYANKIASPAKAPPSQSCTREGYTKPLAPTYELEGYSPQPSLTQTCTHILYPQNFDCSIFSARLSVRKYLSRDRRTSIVRSYAVPLKGAQAVFCI